MAVVVIFGGGACGPSASGGSASGSGDAGDASATAEASGATGTDGLGSSGGATTGQATTDPECPADASDEGMKLDVLAEAECHMFQDDCDPGSKCVPREHATMDCVVQSPDPLQDGEPCEPAADADPCGAGSWCAIDPGGQTASCTPMCSGSFADPVCPEGRVCIIDDETVVAECQVPCDPFDPLACGEGTCQPTARGFGCLQAGFQTDGAQCYEDDSCVGGLVCAPGDQVAGCCDDGCCAAMCSPDHPCAVGTCVPMVPPVPGATDVGYCMTA